MIEKLIIDLDCSLRCPVNKFFFPAIPQITTGKNWLHGWVAESSPALLIHPWLSLTRPPIFHHCVSTVVLCWLQPVTSLPLNPMHLMSKLLTPTHPGSHYWFVSVVSLLDFWLRLAFCCRFVHHLRVTEKRKGENDPTPTCCTHVCLPYTVCSPCVGLLQGLQIGYTLVQCIFSL